MPYFTIHKTFLIDSFELDEKKKGYLDKYLEILEDSGIGEIIQSATNTDYSKGGRPSYNPYKLFAAIAYSFSKSPGSLRDIEDLMKYDLRVIYLMDQMQCLLMQRSRGFVTTLLLHFIRIYMQRS